MKGRLYKAVKSREEIESSQLFNTMLQKIDGTNSVVIDGRNLMADSIFAKHIMAGEIITDHLASDAITADKIHAGAITTGKIAAGAITAEEIAADAITAEKILAGTITADEIQAEAITTDKIHARAITADKIAVGTITAEEISAGAITTEKLHANSITAEKIASGAITAEKIDAGAITIGKFNEALKDDINNKATKEDTQEIEQKINNAVTTIDINGITVSDGNFFLRDSSTDTKYSIVSTSNMFKDHSFELLEFSKENSPFLGGWLQDTIVVSSDARPDKGWAASGQPLIYSTRNRYHDKIISSLNMFGSTQAIVDSVNWLYQDIPINSDDDFFTISGHFRKYKHRYGYDVRPTIDISLVNYLNPSDRDTPDVQVEVISDVHRWTFDIIDISKGMVRDSTTVDVRSILLPNKTIGEQTYLRVRVTTNNTEYVIVDGMQAVKGKYMTKYEPEDSFYGAFSSGIGDKLRAIDTEELVADRIFVKGEIEHQNGHLYGNYATFNTIGALPRKEPIDIQGPIKVNGPIHMSGLNLEKSPRITDFHKGTIYDTASFWSSLPQGTYYVGSGDIPNQPISWGWIHVMSVSTRDEWMVYFYPEIGDTIYMKKGTSSWNRAWEMVTSERGTNSNGDWIRFPDGTQICYMFTNTSMGVSLSTWSGKYRGFLYDYFPKSFIAPPAVTISGLTAITGMELSSYVVDSVTDERVGVAILSNVKITDIHRRSFIAIGRWK